MLAVDPRSITPATDLLQMRQATPAIISREGGTLHSSSARDFPGAGTPNSIRCNKIIQSAPNHSHQTQTGKAKASSSNNDEAGTADAR